VKRLNKGINGEARREALGMDWPKATKRTAISVRLAANTASGANLLLIAPVYPIPAWLEPNDIFGMGEGMGDRKNKPLKRV
jgi:hypothetical protein